MDEKICFTTALTFGRHWQIEGWRGGSRLRVEFDSEAVQVIDNFPRHVLAKAVQKSFSEERAAAVYRFGSDKFSHWLVAVTKDDLRESCGARGISAH